MSDVHQDVCPQKGLQRATKGHCRCWGRGVPERRALWASSADWGRETEVARQHWAHIILLATLHLVKTSQKSAGTFHLGQVFPSLSSAQLQL